MTAKPKKTADELKALIRTETDKYPWLKVHDIKITKTDGPAGQGNWTSELLIGNDARGTPPEVTRHIADLQNEFDLV